MLIVPGNLIHKNDDGLMLVNIFHQSGGLHFDFVTLGEISGMNLVKWIQNNSHRKKQENRNIEREKEKQ